MKLINSFAGVLCTSGLLFFSNPLGIRAENFTTVVVQASGQNWNGTIWDPGPVAPSAGNAYATLDNGIPFGNNQANTRIRNPAAVGIQTFPGDSLTLSTNTEIRAKQPGAILNFPGTNGNPGLILNGGVLNAGDDAVFEITGAVQIASTSYIVPGDNGGGAIKPLRGFKFSGQVSGSGELVIYQAGTNVAQEFSGGQNKFSGDILVKAGWLKGSGLNSLGTGSIIIDPLADVGADPSVTPAEGPALVEFNYDASSPGTLILTNGGLLNLHQNITYRSVNIEGTALSNGPHSYDEVAAAFPNNIIPGGSGSIIVQPPVEHFTTKATQGSGQNWTANIWDPGQVAPQPGATYELLTNGTPFGNNLSNTRVRNPAVAGLQTFPGDSLTLNGDTELRAKQSGAILNFPGVNGKAGLILNGGVLNPGDDAVFTITGKVQVVATSYIVPGDNGGGAIKPLRGFNIAGQLSGSGELVIYQAGTNVAQEISGTNNPFNGTFLVKAGYLKGSGSNSLGTASVIIDPKAAITVDPSVTPAAGPAWFEVNYDLTSPATLTVINGGQVLLHQNVTFDRVNIEGVYLDKGTHPFAELAAAFPNNFATNGSGSITVTSGPQHYVTTITQGTGTDWNGAIWTLDVGGPTVPPQPGNAYELIDNGTPFGAALNNTRVRNPAVAGLQTFPGDSLTIDTNTEIRAKGPGAILNFPGVGGKPGLILNGGNLNAGDDAVFVITGRVEVASTSFIVPADNGGGAITPLRGFNIAGELSGSGSLVIYQAGTTVAQEISGNNNPYTGDILLVAGWLKGSGTNSLGSGNITVDPYAPLEVDPSVALQNGPAQFEPMYDIFTTGTLTLQNGGMMILHQNATFGAANIEGTPLTSGAHPYDELVASFPSNFAPGGSGSITVKPPSAPLTPTNLAVVIGDTQVNLSWGASPGATGYIVSRSTTVGGPYTAVSSQTGISFNNSGLTNGTTYYYVVVATNQFGASAQSAEIAARPNPPVTGVAASVSGANATLQWTQFPGATGYSILRATTAGGPYTNIATGVTGTSYQDTSVSAGTFYYYRVIASLAGGFQSGISLEASVLLPPSVPTLITKLFATTVGVVQVNTPDPAGSQFLLERGTNAQTLTALATLTGAGYTNTGLSLGATYYFRAKAQNASGTSAYSPVVSLTTPTFGINVNFANATNGTPTTPAPIPPGYVQDVGEVFETHTNGLNYGWDRDITPDGRWRQNANSPDLRYDTFVHLEKTLPSAIWEIEIPNGTYTVHIVSGDVTATDSVFEHDIEGVVTDTYTPTNGAWWGEWTLQNVQVTDGRLTVTSGPDAANNKINLIDIYTPIAVDGQLLKFTSFSISGNALTLNWTPSAARLQSSDRVDTGYTDVTGNPQPPATVQMTDPHRFYRLAE
ncbi:MAG TPA: hypothetical protein VGR78_17555 [Verrucomicrobiae bacterium]|nr:hypothetical protein [Verrucomicrobiae bacterium]